MPPPPTPVPSIAVLLNLVPDRPSSVLQSLAQHPQLASLQDQYGYSLVHAASSYCQLDLLRALIRTYNVDVNLRDEDGQTALFNVESREAAKCLVEELGIDTDAKDNDGLTAVDFIKEDGSFPDAVEYLESLAQTQTDGIHPPPPLPPNVRINLGTMEEPPGPAADGEDGLDGPDPEFRRRIEELAAREDFHGEEGQAQLRELITDAVRGVVADAASDERGGSRRRVG